MSRFKDLRIARGLTQVQLAKKLGTSQQTISRVEFNDEMVPTEILIKASKFYNVSVDYILGLSDEKHNGMCAGRMQEYLLEHENFMEEYAALKPEYQDAVKNVVRTLTCVQESNEK